MHLPALTFASFVQLFSPTAAETPVAPAKPEAPITLAQAPTPSAEKPPAAAPPAMDNTLNAVVDTLQKTYEGTKSFSGRFEQKFTYVMLRRTQASSGQVLFEKPGKMRWDYDKPAPKSFLIDGKALWVVQPQDKLAYVNACFQQDGLTASVAFLWGDGNLREQFNISWFDGVFGDKSDHHLLLVPKDGNSVFARLILVVDPKTSRVKQSVVVDPAGNVNQFMFSDLKFNVGGLDNKTFSYTPSPGVNAARMPGTCNAPVPGLKG